MNQGMLCQAVSAAALAALALAAGAQPSSSSHPMTTPPTASTVPSRPPLSDTASQAATDKAARATTHDAKRHSMAQRNHTRHGHMTTASPAGNEETAYQTALKRCVQGSPGARDSCLDDAIMKHQRS
jgi:hypothetical protein